jgi:hypothetical protein
LYSRCCFANRDASHLCLILLLLTKFILLRKILLILFFIFPLTLFSQTGYWQQTANFTIDVTLDDTAHTLDGFEKIEYFNNSPDTLHFIWFHLWPNAYKHDKTAFTDQSLENGSMKFYFSNAEDRGYINRLDFRVNGITATVTDHPQHVDIVKLELPAALPPGGKIMITTPFHVKLPFNFSRGGHDGQSYQATQWFPKPAVYDRNGWHPMPYLDQGEYYSEFGNFDVRITVPTNYVVAATGQLQDEKEKSWLMSRADYKWTPPRQKQMVNGQLKNTIQEFPPSDHQTKTLYFRQENVHDFAWFADKRFIVKIDTCALQSGRVIEVHAYYTPGEISSWANAYNDVKKAVRHYSALVGEYPYSIAQVVQGPESFGGGMEYPTITIISPIGNPRILEKVIVHEVGHNWFYGILGSNERDYPWLDEGLNSYYENRYSRERFRNELQLERLVFETAATMKTDQPINTPSEKFSAMNYGLVAYYKTSEWMRYMESRLGTELFDKAMQEYYRRWKFKHPYPEDFRKTLEEITQHDLSEFFVLLDKKGSLPSLKTKGTRTALIFNINALTKYARDPSKELVLVGPALGGNSYDKLLAGIFVTNMKLPPSRFQYLLAPMYGTGSKEFAALGFGFYSFYPEGIFNKIELGANGSMFRVDEYAPGDGKKTYLGMHKIVPGIKLTLREKDPRSSFNRFIQFKTYFIGEEGLQFYRDTVISGIDTTISTKHRKIEESRTLAQLQFVIENNRVLYPYRGEWRLEKGKDFYRAAFTGKYFFNYPKGGGLDLRLFAGKFFYEGSKTFKKQFATDRYHLNLTGANGYEDYTYSDYFIGRNKFEGLPSQQIMVRDGAFKVRSDLLAAKIGKTDDWLAAINLTTTIPTSINPLELLPVKIPLRLFLDIGTYAESWKHEAETDRFLFDAGVQLAFLKETVNIYIPLVYSSVFREYIESTFEKKKKFWKKISFSIDLSNFSLRRFDRNLNF